MNISDEYIEMAVDSIRRGHELKQQRKMKQLPSAQRVLEQFYEIDKDPIPEAMKEYCRQVLDYVAENATLNFDEAGRMRVNKESILKIKNELL